MSNEHDTASAEMEHRLARQGDALRFLQLITRTFVNLALTEKLAICDTLLSLVVTHLDVEAGAMLLLDPDSGELLPASARGIDDEDALLGGADTTLIQETVTGRLARDATAEEVRTQWPAAPDAFREGFAAVVVDIQEVPVALLLVGHKIDGQPILDEELDFLDAVAGIAALILTNAEAQAHQQALLDEVEQHVTEARQEAAAKEEALQQLDTQLDVVERQQLAIQELSTPILTIWDQVLVLPLIGLIDTKRSADVMDHMLNAILTSRARFAILDVTGVQVVDTRTADYLIRVAQAAQLIGADCILSGIRPAVAQTLVEIGVDLGGISIAQDLKGALQICIRRLSQEAKRSLSK